MSEIQAAVDQPTQSSEPQVFSWLNEESKPAETSPETPEPIEAEAAEQPSVETETEQQVEPSSEEQPESSSMDDFLAALVPEERARYAKRYPNAWKLANDPNQPEDVRQLLRDKINTDYEYKRLREQPAEQEEPTLETEEEQPAAEVNPDQQRQQYYQQVDAIAKQIDPKAVEDLGTSLIEALGVDTKSQDPEVQALVKNAGKVGSVLARGAVDLMATALPSILLPQLGQYIDQVFPGTLANVERQTYASAWESVRASNPAYAKLPAFGPADGEFGKLMRKAAAEIPGFDKMQFPGTVAEQAQAKYALLAQQISRGKVTPVEVANAIKAGEKNAKVRQQNIAAGQALGAGKSNSAIDGGKNENQLSSWIQDYMAEQRSTPLK